jgi:hypothetical protein
MLVVLAACGEATTSYRQCPALPPMHPNYADITIPYNIAPLNFEIDSVERIELLIKGERDWTFESRGSTMRFNERKWREMLDAERGNELLIHLTTLRDNEHCGWRSFTWTISEDKIDNYLSYRLIEPAYEVWNELQIVERNVENFDERLLGDNISTDRSCMNCHTSNRAERPANFMHVRGKRGGTIYSYDGKVRKINTSTPHTSGSAVYGEIERGGRYGIFTTADIVPILHLDASERMEVYDRSSDLIVIDFEQGTVSDNKAIRGVEYQETFPAFAADGHTVYFCRAVSRPQPDSTTQMMYSLCAIDFDPQTGRLGDEVRTVIDAESVGRSFSFPKCSPDGRWLMVTVSDYGTFPIWHSETDLWLVDLQSGAVDTLAAVNGRYSDSYHSWSSTSRWVVFASKRDDRVYGRPYIAHVDSLGRVSAPFVLPQRDPAWYRTTLKSMNIPELYPQAESYDARAVRRVYFDKEAETFEYKENN